jgi:transglutaminase-like putative cysteine protease
VSGPEPRSRTAGRRSGGRPQNWSMSVALLLLVAFSLGSLTVLLSGGAWWVPPFLVAMLVLLTAGAVRGIRASRFRPFLAGLGTLLITLTVFFAADTALLGIVPLEGTLERANELMLDGRVSIAEQAAPADASTGIVFILAVSIGCLALAADTITFALRAPALTAVPALALMVVPVVVLPGGFNAAYFLLAAAAYLALLVLDRRRPQPLRALAPGVAALVLAFVLPAAVPAPSSAGGPGISGGASIGVNPVIDLGQDLRRPNATLAFTYTTTSTEALYFKLTTLTDFDGDNWEPVGVETLPNNTVNAFGVAEGLSEQVPRTEVKTTVEVGDLAARWLPVPYPATGIEGLDGSWFWEPAGLSVRTNEANARHQLYTVSSLGLRPTEEQLDAASPGAGPQELAVLPGGLPPNIAETAQAVTSEAETDYDRAVALQNFFTGGEFAYSEKAPVDQDFDGTGGEAISKFLDVRSGYCVHFASGMAVMSRALGIPSRVIVGFQPGQPQFRDGEFSHFEVTTHDLHAWPELFFEDVGWVRFEPTPGRGDRPDYEAPVADDPATPEVDESVPSPQETTAPTQAPRGLTEQSLEPGAPTGGGADPTGSALAGLLITGAVVLLLLPAALRMLRRRKRLQAVRTGVTPATAAWAETLDVARDLGVRIRSTETARVSASRIVDGLPPDATAAVARLRRAVEAESYATTRLAPSEDDVDLVRAALRRIRSLRDRVLAVFAPRSLLLMLPGSRD